MQKRSPLFLLVFLLALSLNAQNGTPAAAGAKGLAMGNTGTTHTGIYALFSNPAGLADLDQVSVTVFGEQRFLLSELTILNAGFAMPTKSGNFGLQIQQFGFDKFTEQKIGLAYARALSSKISLGAKLDFLNTRIPEYGSQATFTFELGLRSQISKTLALSAHVFSPLEVSVSEDYDIPSVFSLGIAYKSSEKLWVTLEGEKDIDHPISVKAGIEYLVTENFYLRVGAATEPTLITFGIGYKKKNLSVDVASAYHQDLGMMPALSAIYSF